MSLLTIKTKTPQQVVVGSSTKHIAYVEFLELFQRPSGYKIRYDWYYLDADGNKKPIAKSSNAKDITIEQANAISTAAAPLTDGKTKWEREMIELEVGAFQILDADKDENWGLTKDDYEVHTDEAA